MEGEFTPPKFDVPKPVAARGGDPLAGLWSVLSKPAKTTPLEDYNEHPLNIDKQLSTARIIRGMEGMSGQSLVLAVFDVVIGLSEKLVPPKKETPPGD